MMHKIGLNSSTCACFAELALQLNVNEFAAEAVAQGGQAKGLGYGRREEPHFRSVMEQFLGGFVTFVSCRMIARICGLHGKILEI
jgi:hypothetical protein